MTKEVAPMGSTTIETKTCEQIATFVVPSRPHTSWTTTATTLSTGSTAGITSGVVRADLDPTYQGMGLPTVAAAGFAVRGRTGTPSGDTSWSPPV
jgi:hypothetical protein